MNIHAKLHPLWIVNFHEDKDKEALFTVTYNVTDNISS